MPKSANAHKDTNMPNRMGQSVLRQIIKIIGTVRTSPSIRFLTSLAMADAGRFRRDWKNFSFSASCFSSPSLKVAYSDFSVWSSFSKLISIRFVC